MYGIVDSFYDSWLIEAKVVQWIDSIPQLLDTISLIFFASFRFDFDCFVPRPGICFKFKLHIFI
jgi:hypothetical protein